MRAEADERIVSHLRRIEGQIRGLQGMVHDDRECEAVLTQILAVKAALDRVATDLVEAHVDTCFTALSEQEFRTRLGRVLALLGKL